MGISFLCGAVDLKTAGERRNGWQSANFGNGRFGDGNSSLPDTGHRAKLCAFPRHSTGGLPTNDAPRCRSLCVFLSDT